MPSLRSRWAPRVLCASLLGCAPASPDVRLADEIVEAPGATGEGLGDPQRAVDGVRGAGEYAGSFDVYSLARGEDAYLVLGFSGGVVLDVPGDELVIFENAFRIAGSTNRFMDPLVVEVSSDVERWVAFPHDYLAPDEGRWSYDPAHWQGFAGITPVLLHEEGSPGDPFDSVASGGDPFDLAELGESPEAAAIRAEGGRYVRLSSARIVINPDTGLPFPHDLVSDGPDIDGVYARVEGIN